MRYWRRAVLFYLGGSAYMFLEFLWRGRSHGSMFLLGGACFLVLGQLQRWFPGSSPALREVLGAGAVTVLELCTGLLVNRDYAVWDYRQMPLNFMGHICLSYSLLWIPVSLAGIALYTLAEKKLLPRTAA